MIITQTPLRVSFAGGGTDLAAYYVEHGGYVVSTAIDKSVFVLVNERFDDKIYVNYSRKEIVDDVDELQHDLVREAMRTTGVRRGVEVTMLSDIPSQGSGLGSSSSFTVGLLNAFYMYRGRQVSPEQLAEEACEIEIDRCGKPIGKQDQYIAAFGGLHAFTFCRDGRVETERIELAPGERRRLSSCLLLFYSDQTRSSETVLKEQRDNTHAKTRSLNDIRSLARETYDCLAAGHYDKIGSILHRNWELKRELASQISNDRLEAMYDLASGAGATGGKVCGAGGGGFLMTYCPPPRQEQLIAAMGQYRCMHIGIEPDGSKAIFNYRRTSWE